MSDTIISIETLNITINLPAVKQTSEEKQAEFAESVRIERAAKVAEQELAVALASADIVHSSGYPEYTTRPATLREKVAYIQKQFEAIAARVQARKQRQQSFR
jgi:hypothetical protein